jgi:hypothetical protein
MALPPFFNYSFLLSFCLRQKYEFTYFIGAPRGWDYYVAPDDRMMIKITNVMVKWLTLLLHIL